jgi:hypothetical protein
MYESLEISEGERQLERLLRRVDRTVYQTEYEAESYAPHPEIAGVCTRATRAANNLRTQLQRAAARGRPQREIRFQGAKWLSDTSNAFIGRLDRYHPRDLDRLAGCLTRVEAVVGLTPANLRRLRAAIAQRLRMPAGAAFYEGEGEIFGRVGGWLKKLVSGGQKPKPASPPPSGVRDRDSVPPTVGLTDAGNQRKKQLPGIISSLAGQIIQAQKEGRPVPAQVVSNLQTAINDARDLGADQVDLRGPQALVDAHSRR